MSEYGTVRVRDVGSEALRRAAVAVELVVEEVEHQAADVLRPAISGFARPAGFVDLARSERQAELESDETVDLEITMVHPLYRDERAVRVQESVLGAQVQHLGVFPCPANVEERGPHLARPVVRQPGQQRGIRRE